MKLASVIRRIALTCFFLAIPLLNLPFGNHFLPAVTVKAAEVTKNDDEDNLKIKLNVNSKSIVNDDTYDLKVYRTQKNQKITFKSSDTDVCTVKKTDDKEATITACSVGKATITVTIREGFKVVESLKCEITVTPPALSIKITDGNANIKVGDKFNIKKELKPSTTAEVPVFTSSNPKVATVSSKGIVTAVAPGKVKITATISNGETDSCSITVEEYHE